jgi:tRNA1(Val) A37 N6-methylase TrmN6
MTAHSLATTDDVFLDGRLRLLQPVKGHRAGIDAVLLAASVEAPAEARVLDAGAGCGIVGLAIASRLALVHVTGIEIEPELAALAQENARRNGLDARVRVAAGDVAAPAGELAGLGLRPGSFDVIVSNPPYLDADASQASPFPLQARASSMPEAGLERWARFFAAMARPGGALYLIHRADALRAIFDALDGRFGALAIRPLHPRADEPATRLIVHAIKGSRAPLRLLPGLVLHSPDGKFMPEVERVLRATEPLRGMRV